MAPSTPAHGPSTADKARYALYSAIVFLLISSPAMYKVTSYVLGPAVAVGGCPRIAGLLLHTVVFFLIVFGLMFLPL